MFRRRDDGIGMLYAWFGAMHTRVDVVLAGRLAEDGFLNAVCKARRQICIIEKTANCFDPQSELSAVNLHAADGAVSVSSMLESILLDCLRYNRITGGLFDITVGVNGHDATMVRDIIIPGDGTIAFRRRGLHINLSGFIKGYALEQLRSVIETSGVEAALVSMGNSSVLAMGSPLDGEGWKVGFGNGAGGSKVTLHDECLTTSGNDTSTRRHIVNPLTGQLVEGCRTVSVITRNAAEGEVLSTCLFIDPAATFPAFGAYRMV